MKSSVCAQVWIEPTIAKISLNLCIAVFTLRMHLGTQLSRVTQPTTPPSRTTKSLLFECVVMQHFTPQAENRLHASLLIGSFKLKC